MWNGMSFIGLLFSVGYLKFQSEVCSSGKDLYGNRSIGYVKDFNINKISYFIQAGAIFVVENFGEKAIKKSERTLVKLTNSKIN